MQTTANEIGNMAIHIFGRNTLEKGDAVFVANETSIDIDENEKKFLSKEIRIIVNC